MTMSMMGDDSIREFCPLDMPVIMLDRDGERMVMTLGEVSVSHHLFHLAILACCLLVA